MPIESLHEDYEKAAPRWKKFRTVLEGEEAVKAAADLYLPKPRGFENKDYLWKEYVQRSEFYPAASRTVVGLLGSMFRRAPAVELPAAYESWKRTITQEGVSVEGVCKLISKDLLEIGRYGLLVDMPAANEKLPGIKARPYIACYCAEQITNWALSTIENPDRPGEILLLPSLVVLKECVTVPNPADIYKREKVEQYRSLELDSNGTYCVKIFRKIKTAEKNEWVQFGETLYPMGPDGRSLRFIPFIFISPEGLSSSIERSPIEDLISVSLSHWTTAADLEWACHLTASPMPIVTGWQDKSVELAIGAGVAWTFLDDKVKVKLLEYTGTGIEALEARCRAKEEKMAKLGAMLLRTKNKQPETAETTRIEHGAESSVLSMIARNASAAMTRALSWCVWWASALVDKTVSVEQNTEFYDARLTYQELDSLMAGVQSGALPVSVYVYNLIRGDMVKNGAAQDELEQEVEKSLKAAEPPPPVPGLPPGSTPPSPLPGKKAAPPGKGSPAPGQKAAA